jgi:hypothetical protein
MTKKYLKNTKKQSKLKKIRLNNKTRKNKSSKKQKAGCNNCLVHSQNIPAYVGLKGGSHEPPSFSNVPIHSFYKLNDYINDPLNQQISTRILPNMNGGKRKNKKTKGGFSDTYVYNTTDPLLNNTNNVLLSSSNISGAILGSNILNSIPMNTSSTNTSQFLV